MSHRNEPGPGQGQNPSQSGLTTWSLCDFMGRVFIFTIICLGLTLILSAIVIWTSFNERDEALYESQLLGVKNAETRENPDLGKAPVIDPDSEPDLALDYTKLTPGLQQLLREGKLNPEITVDRAR